MSPTPLERQSGTVKVPLGKGDCVQLALSMCESGRLEYVSPTCCRLKMSFTAPDEEEWWNLDLDTYVLPGTALVPPCKLPAEPRLTIATILAIDLYLCSADFAKGTHRTIATMASTIAKIWEWGRLNGIYRPEDWTTAHFRRLEKALAKGRWAVALQAESRVSEFLKTRPDPEVISRSDSGFKIREKMRALLHTNLSTQELSCAKNKVHRYVHPVQPANGWATNRVPSQPTLTWLLQAFWAANLLVNVPAPYRFNVTPYPNPMIRAKKLSKPNERTPTLSVEQAIGLLVHSLKYVYDYSGVIHDLVNEAGRIFSEIEKAKLAKKKRELLRERLWEQSPVRVIAKNRLGIEVSILSRGGPSEMTIPKLVEMLMSACVVLIAGLNGRRKDEIIHKALGLRRDSIKPINEELQVYEGTFYIEKTLKSYAPYFVNKTTYDAYTALQLLECAQLNQERLHTKEDRNDKSLSHSMFWSRSWAPSTSRLQPRTWFAFTFDRQGAGRAFTAAALGQGLRIAGGGAHVFRRFYAIIYFYRFEHGGLLAIRYQFGHLDCETTKQYVTSAMIQAVEARIPIELRRPPEAVQAAIDDEWHELDKAINDVGNEKLHGVIADFLGGQTFSGGFPRLVERLHRRFMTDIDYSAMDTARQARKLQHRLASRGHALRPLPHADCAAGTSRARGAKCSETKGGGPAPENASAKVCSGCPYSWTSKGHVSGLKMDLEVLNRDIAEVSPDTLIWERRVASRVNLQAAIWLHEKRIGKE